MASQNTDSQFQPTIEPPDDRRLFLLRAVRYPEHYTWYIFLSTLDLLFTWLILHADGREENVIAEWIIHHFNLPGIVLFKFGMVCLVVLICEVVGRHRPPLGHKLARWAVVLGAFPAVVGGIHLLRIVLMIHG